MSHTFYFVAGIVAGRLMADISEWLRKRQNAKENLSFAEGYWIAAKKYESNRRVK